MPAAQIELRRGYRHDPRHADSRPTSATPVFERACRARLAQHRIATLLPEVTELLADLAGDPRPSRPDQATGGRGPSVRGGSSSRAASCGGSGSGVSTPDSPGPSASHALSEELRVVESAERLKGVIESGALLAIARLHATAEAEVAARAEHLSSVPISAREAVVLEVSTATGLNQTDVGLRLDLATGSARRTGFLKGEVQSGRVPLARACEVLSETASLSDEAVDEIARTVLAPTRDGAGLTQSLFRQRLRRAILTVDPEGAAARRRAARCRNGAYARIFDDGTGTLTITNDADKIAAAIDRADAIARKARAAGDERSLDQLRADFLTDTAILGWPRKGGSFPRLGRQPAGTVWVVVPARTALGLDETPCELPGHGWVSAAQARAIMTAPGSMWRRLLVDDESGRALKLAHDAYAPTPEMVSHVQAVDGTCRAPGCEILASRCDLDHETAWPEGPTALGNLTAKHRRHHNLKTAGLWKSRRGPDDEVEWRTFAGRRYFTLPKDWLAATRRRPDPDSADPQTTDSPTSDPPTGDPTTADLTTADLTTADPTTAKAQASGRSTPLEPPPF